MLFVGFLIVGITVMFTVPRLLNLMIEPEKVYPLYGFHYSAHRAITRLTNIKFFTWIFGDSSYIVDYLRGLGYDLNQVEQTGSNFGTEIQHETPYLARSVAGRWWLTGCRSSTQTSRARRSAYRGPRSGRATSSATTSPTRRRGRTGDNCLLATKVMVPIDGKVRKGVGCSARRASRSPARSERDSRFDHLRTGAEFGAGSRRRTDTTSAPSALFLFIRWLPRLVLTVIASVPWTLYE